MKSDHYLLIGFSVAMLLCLGSILSLTTDPQHSGGRETLRILHPPSRSIQ